MYMQGRRIFLDRSGRNRDAGNEKKLRRSSGKRRKQLERRPKPPVRPKSRVEETKKAEETGNEWRRPKSLVDRRDEAPKTETTVKGDRIAGETAESVIVAEETEETEEAMRDWNKSENWLRRRMTHIKP